MSSKQRRNVFVNISKLIQQKVADVYTYWWTCKRVDLFTASS